MADPDIKDLPIPTPPSRFGDPSSLQYGITDLYSAMRVIAVLDRQARGALIAQSQIADIAALTLTAGGAYSQTDFQTVIDKVNEVIAALAALKSAAASNIQSLVPEAGE